MKKLKNLKLFGLVAFLTLFAGTAFAGTGGAAEFGNIYTTIQDWATGTIGKILVLLMLGSAIFFSVVKPNFIMVMASILMGLIVANLTSIVDSLVTAGIPLV